MNRLSDMQKQLAVYHVDAMLMTSPVNRRYITGFASSAGMALVTEDAGFFFTDARYIEAARTELSGFVVKPVDREKTYKAQVGALLAECGVKSLGFEQNTMTVNQYKDLKTAWPEVTLVPAQRALDLLRQVKTNAEITLMRASQQIAEAAFDALLSDIRPGLTERQVRANLICRMYEAGADGLSFDPIVVAGPNSALPHGEAGEKSLEKGDFLTLDFGVVHKGYCSDTTRTIALGTVSQEMRRVYNTVLRAQQAGIERARAGVTGADIHNAARAVIAEAGYDNYFGHGFGHGIGLEVHESGGASPSETTPLPSGAVLSAEPGIYLPGRFGVRIEDVIVLNEGGCENLTGLGKELLVL